MNTTEPYSNVYDFILDDSRIVSNRANKKCLLAIKKNCDITRNDKQIGFSALILQYTDNNMGNVWSFDNLNSNF